MPLGKRKGILFFKNVMALLRAGDMERNELLVKIAARDAQQLSGLGLVAAALLQGFGDGAVFRGPPVVRQPLGGLRRCAESCFFCRTELPQGTVQQVAGLLVEKALRQVVQA